MILLVSFVVLVLAVGLIYAAHACYWGLTLKSEINPLEVMTLAVNICIVVLLQNYFARKITDLRSEKDILIGTVDDVLVSLRACRDALSAWHGRRKITPTDTHQILQLFRRLSNAIGHLEDALAVSQCRKLAPELNAIWHACDQYK